MHISPCNGFLLWEKTFTKRCVSSQIFFCAFVRTGALPRSVMTHPPLVMAMQTCLYRVLNLCYKGQISAAGILSSTERVVPLRKRLEMVKKIVSLWLAKQNVQIAVFQTSLYTRKCSCQVQSDGDLVQKIFSHFNSERSG